MQGYTDAKGRTWKIPVYTIGLNERIKRECGVDTFAAMEKGADFVQLLLQPFTLARVLWVCLRQQAESLGVSEEEFADTLTGEALDALGSDLAEEISGFFYPRKELSKEVRSTMRTRIDKIDSELAARWRSMSTDSQESLASSQPT